MYNRQMRDMPNLDFVRSVAVVTVVVEHTLLALGVMNIGPYETQYMGVLGVLVFFVLTALVLMWSLERKPHTLDFYIRRWFRIYPLALAVMAIAYVLHAPTAGSPDSIFEVGRPGWVDVLTQMSLLQAPQVWFVSVMWSLPYEVEMYVLLPMLFFFVRRNFSLWPLLAAWALVLLNASGVDAYGHNFAVAIGYFLPGIMAYVAYGRWKAKLPGWLLPVFLAAAWAGFWYDFDFHKGWWFCLLVGLGLPMFRQMTSEMVLAPSRVIARYSYGIYLTHPFAIVIGMYLLAGHSLAMRLGAEAVALVVFPLLAYHLLERPLIRVGSRLAAKAESAYEQRQLKHFAKRRLR